MSDQPSDTLSVLRMITAPISIIASVTMISMIVRSDRKLATTQNRLLVGLSISDILASFAMTLTTLPMPVGTPNKLMPIGNMATCEAQGFFFILGSLLTPCYNASLCLFFLFKVRFNFSDEAINKKVEPFLHGIPLSIAIPICVYALVHDYLNPAVGMCYISDYPPNCTNEPDVECERGEGLNKSWAFRTTAVVMFMIVPIMIFTSMGCLYSSVKSQERRVARFGRGSLNARSRRPRRRNGRPSHARSVMNRGIAYSGAWLITFISPATMFGLMIVDKPVGAWLTVLVGIFHPLQGVLNFCIYVYPKVNHTRRLNQNLSLYEAFVLTLKAAEQGTAARRRRSVAGSMAVRGLSTIHDLETGPPSFDNGNNISINEESTPQSSSGKDIKGSIHSNDNVTPFEDNSLYISLRESHEESDSDHGIPPTSDNINNIVSSNKADVAIEISVTNPQEIEELEITE